VVRASRELEPLYGHPQGTSNGGNSSFADRVHPHDLPDLRRTLDTAVAAQRLEAIETACWRVRFATSC